MTQTQTKKHAREYETIFLVKPELTDEVVDGVKERVRGIIGREGGKMIRFTVWGKKKTSYPIEKQPRAIYIHSHYLGGPALVAEIERNLRNFDEVSRYLSVKLADEVDPDSRETLEDLKLAGDIEDTSKPPEREGTFRSEEIGYGAADLEEEATEEV